jgi:hypothetical protein
MHAAVPKYKFENINLKMETATGLWNGNYLEKREARAQATSTAMLTTDSRVLLAYTCSGALAFCRAFYLNLLNCASQ